MILSGVFHHTLSCDPVSRNYGAYKTHFSCSLTLLSFTLCLKHLLMLIRSVVLGGLQIISMLRDFGFYLVVCWPTKFIDGSVEKVWNATDCLSAQYPILPDIWHSLDPSFICRASSCGFFMIAEL